MTTETDPWVARRTYHDLPADQVISALQKEIRRGHTEQAALLAYELLLTSPEAEAFLWLRLQVISVEDIGFGQVQAPILVHTLHQMHQQFPRTQTDRFLFAIHAVRYLCGCQKDRSSDECLAWMSYESTTHGQRPTIPDYALDMHTAAGRQLGRGLRHFLEEGAQIAPEWDARDRTYRDRLMKMLDEQHHT